MPRTRFLLSLIAFAVFANGILLLLNSLAVHVTIRGPYIAANNLRLSVTIVAGMTLIYLATLLNRRKQAAWLITLLVYAFLFGVGFMALLQGFPRADFDSTIFLRSLLLPIAIVGGLLYFRDEFNVRSDLRNFSLSLRFILIVLLITLLYGVIGFQLLDRRDFHEEISIIRSIHYTIDQFGLTTNHVLVAYTARGRIFLDTLSVVSIMSLFYAIVSLFQPIRAKLTDQTANRIRMERLLTDAGGNSEDFFKLWPHDKEYFFSSDGKHGLAFHVERGVAISVGDPAGSKAGLNRLIHEFEDLCYTNDWTPVFLHTEPDYSDLYRKHGYSLQKIGQEAIVPIDPFLEETVRNKYFRHIVNKFTKQGYTTELLKPPYDEPTLSRLRAISDEWRTLPGRTERGLMMGYFSEDYLQSGPVMVVRDNTGTIQAFMNQVPSFDKTEANYDMLRNTLDSPGNINDFLLIGFIRELQGQGYQRLNMGLCPLAGIDKGGGDKATINSALRFFYSNGDRFYSFSGLFRFKSKYEPQWQDRFVAYKGGIRNFTRIVNAGNRAMNNSAPKD